MTQSIQRLEKALCENGRPLPDDANVTVRAGDLRAILAQEKQTGAKAAKPVPSTSTDSALIGVGKAVAYSALLLFSTAAFYRYAVGGLLQSRSDMGVLLGVAIGISGIPALLKLALILFRDLRKHF